MEPNFFWEDFFLVADIFERLHVQKIPSMQVAYCENSVHGLQECFFFSNSRCPIGTLSGLFIFPPVHIINASEVPSAWVQVPRVPFWCEWGQMMGVLFVLHHSRKIGGWGFPEKMKLSSLRQAFLTELGQRKEVSASRTLSFLLEFWVFLEF